MMEMKVEFITSNAHKFNEMREVCSSNGIILAHARAEYDEPRADDCGTVVSTALKMLASKRTAPFIIEDSGLFIDSLNGFPGAYSAMVYRKIGLDGILRLMNGRKNRLAKFVSVIGYFDGENEHLFEGIAEGSICNAIKGNEGFGYDPLFIPKGYKFTFAENMSLKADVSHRRMALNQFIKFMKGGNKW